MQRHREFSELLRKAGLDPVETAEHFAVRRQQIDTARDRVDAEYADAQNDLTDARVAKQQLDAKAGEVNAELRSLRERKSNIPKRQLDLRAHALPRAPAGCGHAAVRRRADRGPRRRSPTGRARRSGCCTPSPCPSSSPTSTTARCPTGSTGITCGMRIVYYRVPAAALTGRVAPPEPGRGTLAAKLEVKDTVFAAWLERELAEPGRRGVRRDDGRVPPGDPGDHQVRADQGRCPAREGRPVPHRRPQPVRARLEQRAEDRRAARPGRRRSPRGSPRPTACWPGTRPR